MARIKEPTKKQEAGWRKWVANRPPSVRAIAQQFEPWSLYRMKSTGHRVTIASFFEDGTMSVHVTARFNFVFHDRCVFGIDPSDLEPCDLPGADEPVGSILTGTEVEGNLDALRCLVRPDLWKMGDDGVAVRKDN